MKQWLVKNKHYSNDSLSHADIVEAFKKNYSTNTAPYLSWSDARIKAHLRQNNVSIPLLHTRESLLRSMHENCTFPLFFNFSSREIDEADFAAFLDVPTHAAGVQGLAVDAKDFVVDSLFALRDRLFDTLHVFKGYTSYLPLVGEEAKLRAKYAKVQADAISGKITPSGTPIVVRTSLSSLRSR